MARALDPAVLDSLRQLNQEGEPDVLQEVLGIFALDGPARLDAIAAAVRDGNAAALRRSAHALTGAAATIGAQDLRAACRALEELAARGALDGAAGALEAVRREFARARTEIDQLL